LDRSHLSFGAWTLPFFRAMQRSPTTPRPPRRPVPIGASFGAPYSELNEATMRLGRKLAAAEEEGREYAAELREKLDVEHDGHIYDIDLFSMTIQVFAAMTVEAALNEYAVVRFGQHYYEAQSKRPARKRYADLFADLGQDALYREGSECMDRLFSRRNRLVHPATGEYHYEADGSPKPDNPPSTYVPTTGGAARDAIRDMNRLLAIMRELDPEVMLFLHP
jgi:hypothetical protein